MRKNPYESKTFSSMNQRAGYWRYSPFTARKAVTVVGAIKNLSLTNRGEWLRFANLTVHTAEKSSANATCTYHDVMRLILYLVVTGILTSGESYGSEEEEEDGDLVPVPQPAWHRKKQLMPAAKSHLRCTTSTAAVYLLRVHVSKRVIFLGRFF